MGSLFQDVRHGSRSLARSPGFTAVAVLTLAIGIGANTSIFSVIEAVVLRPLPYREPGRLVLLANSRDSEDGGFLYKDFDSLRSENQTLQDVATYYRNSGFSRVTLASASGPLSVQGAFTTANLFPLMGVPPILGRVFNAEEERRKDRVLVLSNGLWVSQFGASPEVVGKTLQIDGFSFQVIGVMPATFQFPASNQQFWAPITTNRFWGDPALTITNSGNSSGFYQRWQAIGRLRRGVELRQAQVELNTIFARLRQADPDPNRDDAVSLIPLRVILGGNTRLAFIVLFTAVGFVLLIACSNVANLLLARGASREREIAVRAVLGASRSRLVRQLFTESVLLALLSACLGLMVVPLGVRFLVALAPADIPRLHEAGVDSGVLAFTLGISCIAAVIFGLVPAWKISGTIGPMNSVGKGIATSVVMKRTHAFLVIAEFAVATVLLTGAGLLVRSFLAVEAVDPGFQQKQILTMNVSVPGASPERTNDVYRAVLERLRALPGIQAVGAIDSLFDLGKINNLGLRNIEGHTPEPEERWTPLRWAAVRGDYFQAMGAPLLRGRYFAEQDGPNSPLVAIIDESMARRYWPNEDAIGKRFKGQDPRGRGDDWLTVVGIVRDMRRSGLERGPIPHVYEPYTQAIDGYRTSDLVVRAVGAPGELAQPLRAVVREIDHSAILSSVITMDQQLSEQLSPRRFQTALLTIFSVVALLLAGVGIYGLLHYSVAQRTHEIGIRMALGADPSEVVKLVVKDGAKLAIAGLVIGAIAATALTRFMKSLFFGVTSTDPVTFASVAILLTTIAFLACYVPARRAARVDPMAALRYE
jgi:putative ABC transport system permease protein